MTIKNLVKKYNENRVSYLKANYNEAQLRMDFLDPLFELLGWDIKNTKGKPTNEREVLLEEPLKEDASSNTKKPDYTFRLFSERKFFLEAKRPNVKIEADNNSAKQVRRYGFTAKLKISVLSNFEYLAIYDCSHKVEQDNSVTKARINLYHYTEYESAFEEIQEKLSYTSVYNGDFDEIWKDIEEQLKLSSVDNLFLSQINEWRLILGKEIYSHKPNISEAGLNDLVQLCLNSIIFLRVCEDRNLENYKTLLNFANNDDFVSLIKKFKLADKKYNASLFNHPLIDEIISNNHSAFWIIIKQLYFPESIYSFSVFASDILGNIYEMFISEQLTINAGKIYLKKKPENIDRDIVTTPTFIIQNILRETVVKHCKDKTDEEIFNSSFADIACGSGAFLLETYQLLQDILVDYYLINDADKLIHTSINTFKLPFNLKRQILESCVFGVDKDLNAVEACKFGLLLKLLEDENNTTIFSPALPDLNGNIHFGNSLIDSSLSSIENQEIINPYDFRDTKFDVIIGNPPYMATEHMKKITPFELPLYKAHYSSAYKQFDKYFLFIEKGFKLLKKEGYFGYIVPSKFSKVGAGKKLREFLTSNKSVQQIISFGANQVFQKKTTYTCLLILKNEEQELTKYLEVNSFKNWKIRNIVSKEFDSIPVNELDENGWILVPGNLKHIYNIIISQSSTLEELVGEKNITNGIQTSKNSLYIITSEKIDDEYVHFKIKTKKWKIEKEVLKKYYKTPSQKREKEKFNTYRLLESNSFVIFPYQKTKEKVEIILEENLSTQYPYLYKYFKFYKKEIKKRKVSPPIGKDDWYKFGRSQHLDSWNSKEKIVVGVLSIGEKYSIDKNETIVSSGGTAGYCIITIPDNSEYSIYYIQALLNSKYLEWFSALIGEVFRGGYIARGTKVLKKLPIRIINFENDNEKDTHDKIVTLQRKLINLQGKIDGNIGNNRKLIPLKRQFETKKKDLDDTLKSLYGLGENDKLIPLISEIYATD